MTNFAPMVPTTKVKNAPQSSPNMMTLNRLGGFSMLTTTSTPTWMPVRTP